MLVLVYYCIIEDISVSHEMQYLLIIIKNIKKMHKLVLLSRIDGLYKISTENLSLNGDILATTFSNASTTTLHILGTKIMLKYWKLEMI